MIYFIQEGMEVGAVKIGYAAKPQDRIGDLQTGNSKKLRVLLEIEGDKVLEKTIHGMFAESNIHGEWFHMTENLLWLIKGAQMVAGSLSRPSAQPLVSPVKATKSSRRKSRSIDLPHANRMEYVVAAVRTAQTGSPFPIQGRHLDYYSHGARILGFLATLNDAWVATVAGKKLLAATPGSDEQFALIRAGMEANPLLQWACLGPERTLDEMIAYMKPYGVTDSTARRRAACLRAWWRFINKQPLHPRK
jgi:Meiotically up-regulated gene 113